MNYVFTNRSDLYIIMEYEIERFLHAPLAQLDRVAHYECEGWGFESLMAHQVMRPFRMHSRETQSMTGFQRFLTMDYRVNEYTDLGMQNGFFCEF